MPDNASTWIVDALEHGTRLDRFLADRARLGSRARAASALERGKVFVNDAEVSLGDAGRRLDPGDRVRVWMDRPGSATARPRAGQYGDLQIVHEDAALLVVNKPAGLLTVPLERNPGVPSVYDAIEQRLRSHGKRRPIAVHRIDQDTSGLVVFAMDPETAAQLKEQFRRRQPERVYRAVVHGRPLPSTGEWRDHLVWDERALVQKVARPGDPGALEAISLYDVIEPLRDASLLEVQLRTGRRNQIRIQAWLHGHPLVGETRYVDGYQASRTIRFPRHALHACRLGLVHPADGRPVVFEAPAPLDLQDLISRLRRRRGPPPASRRR